MLKKDFLEKLSRAWGMPKKEVEAKVNSLFEVITAVLSEKEAFTWFSFGRFCVREKKARTGKNPATGEAIQIPDKIVPVFKASKQLKASVQKG